MNIDIKRFDSNFPLPTPTEGAACFDMFCRESAAIEPKQIKAVPQNFALKVPKGYALLLFARSSTALRKNLMLANSVAVIDPFYCGDDDENLAFLYNFSDKVVTVEAGDRLVQGMIIKVEDVVWNEVQSMGSDGHGGYNHSQYLQ